MEKITKEKIIARDILTACGYDIIEALDRMERARDTFFLSCQMGKAEKCELVIKELKKGVAYV